jgi:hypothetical protein
MYQLSKSTLYARELHADPAHESRCDRELVALTVGVDGAPWLPNRDDCARPWPASPSIGR